MTTLVSATSIAVGTVGQELWGWGLLGWWWVMTGWIASLAFIYWGRFWQGKWRSMRVIEQELPDEVLGDADSPAANHDAA